MRMNRLREIFTNKPISKEQEREIQDYISKKIEEIHEIKLKPKGSVLYAADPFKEFYGDCTYCSHYFPCDLYCGFVTGGYCKLHRVGCGEGFTCKNNSFKIPFFESTKED